MAKKIVLAGACRTAIGSMGGSLSTTPAPELGSIVIKEALKRAGVAPEQVDHVYMGCVIQAGLGQNVARQASLKAGLQLPAFPYLPGMRSPVLHSYHQSLNQVLKPLFPPYHGYILHVPQYPPLCSQPSLRLSSRAGNMPRSH